MALHCELAGLNGGFTTKSKVKRAKNPLQGSKLKLLIILLVLICGSVWVLWNLRDDGFLRKKEKFAEMLEEKARVLHGKFNARKIKVHAPASLFSKLEDQETFSDCLEKTTQERPLSDSGDNAINDVCLEEQFAKRYGWIIENVATQDQCPIYGEIAGEHDPSSVKEEYVQIISSPKGIMYEKDNLSSLQTGCQQNDHERLLRRLVKICWCVLLGTMVNCSFYFFSGRFRMNTKPQPVQEQPPSSKGGGKWRRNLLILWVLAGMIGSMWIFWSMNKNIITRRKELLSSMCDERARMLQDQFNVSMHHVHALAILVSTFHHGKQPSAIDQKTFAEYTERTQFERPLTSGVAYALKVTHSQREQFEKHHGWAIKKMKTEEQSLVQDEYIPEKLDPSPVQDEYAPVIFSQDTVSHIVSIDMMSGKEDRENILRARASGKGVLTSPFKLLKSNHLGVVLTFAVYNTALQPDVTQEERIEATEGYLGASFDVPSLVEKLLHQLASKQKIVVNVYDTTNSSAPINMYGPNVTDMGLWYLSNLDFGDPFRKHEMHCRFKQQPSLPWSAITTSIGVLVIVLLVGHIFHAAVNRIAKVEDDYRKMRELKVRAEAADVAKSEFLTNVSHEIRTPMNGVLGMLQMLMDTDLDATQQDYARTAQNSGKSLIALINEVLDQAKIESGRLELEAVPFDLRSVLDNVLSLFSGKTQEKGIELAVYISDRVPEILMGDPGRFRQIITNLVGNSVKFTEEGHIFVSVQLAEELKDAQEASDGAMKQCKELNGTEIAYNTLSGFRVVDRSKSWERFKMFKRLDSTEVSDRIRLLVMVEDTGVGIPRDAQSRIFMPFMQADSSTSRTYGGTGIGLSISKCLVDLMGGEIGFVSEPRIGSTFSFTSVFMKGQTDSTDMKYHASDLTVSEFKGMRGLVVDGKGVRAEVTKYHLQRLGVNVDVALSMKSAFFCISNACNSSVIESLDMVLVDKEAWGKGTGVAFPRLLKDLTQNGRPKPMLNRLPKMFLLATSISSIELTEWKSSGYVDNVIMKPLRPSMMATCLQQAFGVVNKRHQDHGKSSTLRSLLSEKQILVVDDNSVNRRVAAGALKKYGAIVTCVDSGKVAIAKLEPPHKFDACFMDVQMPEMDGFEATRKIRCIEDNVNEQIKSGKASKENYGNVAHWHIPILAMTADVIKATHEECMRCGMDDYVSKPFEEEKLYSAVAHFFESDGTLK